ncbi:type II secretion system protein GspC [Pseudocolwellia agarivorans]|uniref:type II secretion system protein GspC n=1 Tax=Pseudocolwellia agarivorans TaxID=1911682 RepID=UPI000987AD78|nr:type II secretion system protein GspC [Pseudocolwellia agarivorans]
MQLSRQFSAIAETLLKLPHAKIAKLISLVLFIYIAYLLAKITWLFLDETPQYNQNISNGSVIQSKSTTQNISLSGIYSLNLFGLYNESNVVEEIDEIEDAPETNLNLTLTGVVASNEDDRSAAIIQNNGAQEIYAIDETINGTRAVLKNVYNDRVHIRHSGRLETLMLDGFDYNESKNQIKVAQRKEKANISGPILQSNTPKRVDQRNNNELTKQAQALRDDISADPGKITDYLKIGPKRVNGQIVGYQLMPGKNPDFFKSSGLKSGDVAIQMNGYDLSQPSEAAQALRALKQEREVSLLVNRNDDITEILFSIDNSID